MHPSDPMQQCSAPNCTATAAVMCPKCKTGYCATSCQSASWPAHKLVCATLAEQRSRVEPQPPISRIPAKEIAVSEMAQRITTLAHTVQRDVDESEEELFERRLSLIFTVDERRVMRAKFTRARRLLEAGMTSAIQNIGQPFNAKTQQQLDEAFDLNTELRQQIIERLDPSIAESIRAQERASVVDFIYNMMVEQATNELIEEKSTDWSSVEDIGETLDRAHAVLDIGNEPDGEGEESERRVRRSRKVAVALAGARRRHMIAARKGEDPDDVYRSVLDKIVATVNDLSGPVAKRLALNILGVVTVLSVAGGAYYAAHKAIDPAPLLEEAKTALAMMKEDVVSATNLLDNIETHIGAGRAVIMNVLHNTLQLENLFAQIANLSNQTSKTVFDGFKATLQGVLLDVQKEFLANKEAALLAKEKVNTKQLEAVTDWIAELDAAQTVADIKHVAKAYGQALRGLLQLKKDQSLTMAVGVFNTHMDAAINSTELARDGLKAALERAKSIDEKLSRGIERLSYIRSTAPLTMYLSRLCVDGFAGAARDQLVSLATASFLSPLVALESVFGTFIMNMASAIGSLSFSNVLGPLGQMAVSVGMLAGGLVAGYMSGQFTGLFNYAFGSGVSATMESHQKWVKGIRDRLSLKEGPGWAAWNSLLGVWWYMVGGLRENGRTWQQAVRAASFMNSMVLVAQTIVGMLGFVAAGAIQFKLGLSGQIALNVTFGLLIVYFRSCGPEPIRNIVRRLEGVITGRGGKWISWSLITLSGLALVWSQRDVAFEVVSGKYAKFLQIPPNYWSMATLPTAAELNQTIIAKDSLLTAITTLGQTGASAMDLIGSNVVIAAGVQVAPLDVPST